MASNMACTPLEANHTKTTVPQMPQERPLSVARCSSCSSTRPCAAGGMELMSGPTAFQSWSDRRAASTPITAASGSSDRKTQNAVSAASPRVRVRSMHSQKWRRACQPCRSLDSVTPGPDDIEYAAAAATQ